MVVAKDFCDDFSTAIFPVKTKKKTFKKAD